MALSWFTTQQIAIQKNGPSGLITPRVGVSPLSLEPPPTSGRSRHSSQLSELSFGCPGSGCSWITCAARAAARCLESGGWQEIVPSARRQATDSAKSAACLRSFFRPQAVGISSWAGLGDGPCESCRKLPFCEWLVVGRGEPMVNGCIMLYPPFFYIPKAPQMPSVFCMQTSDWTCCAQSCQATSESKSVRISAIAQPAEVSGKPAAIPQLLQQILQAHDFFEGPLLLTVIAILHLKQLLGRLWKIAGRFVLQILSIHNDQLDWVSSKPKAGPLNPCHGSIHCCLAKSKFQVLVIDIWKDCLPWIVEGGYVPCSIHLVSCKKITPA